MRDRSKKRPRWLGPRSQIRNSRGRSQPSFPIRQPASRSRGASSRRRFFQSDRSGGTSRIFRMARAGPINCLLGRDDRRLFAVCLTCLDGAADQSGPSPHMPTGAFDDPVLDSAIFHVLAELVGSGAFAKELQEACQRAGSLRRDFLWLFRRKMSRERSPKCPLCFSALGQ